MHQTTAYEVLQSACAALSCPMQREEPMKNHTTFRVGGPARCLLLPETEEQLAALLPVLRAEGLPVFYLGRGSNLLVRDGGIEGVVVKLTASFGGAIRLLPDGTVFCPAGKALSDLCLFALEQGLTGLEFAYGIPGSVGGAIYMNAGAYGGEIKDVLVCAHALNQEGIASVRPTSRLNLSYRHSFFAEEDGAGSVIVGGEFALLPGEKDRIRASMDTTLEQRRTKQPLELPSAGSTFKRPEGAYASALIDQCGLKGFSVGGAAVSEKHAGFVVNRNNASCAEILHLVEKVRAIVQEKTGYTLECEVKIIGQG